MGLARKIMNCLLQGGQWWGSMAPVRCSWLQVPAAVPLRLAVFVCPSFPVAPLWLPCGDSPWAPSARPRNKDSAPRVGQCRPVPNSPAAND